MNTQLTDAMESQQTTVMEETGGSTNGAGDGQGEDEMSQDESQEDTQPQSAAANNNQSEVSASTVTDEQPGVCHDQSQSVLAVSDSHEDMRSQPSTSSDDSDSEPTPKPTFPDTLEGFGYHFQGVIVLMFVQCSRYSQWYHDIPI